MLPAYSMKVLMALCVGAAAAATTPFESTCGKDSKVADCDHPDLGSCGTACCSLEVNLTTSAPLAYGEIKAFLETGGQDASYAYSNYTDAAGHDPSDALPDGIPGGFQYIWQGTHATKGGYVDTLNFWVKPIDGLSATLGLFSISNIHGALGDGGQNYKSLVYLLKNFATTSGYSLPTIVHGCAVPGA